MVHKVKFYIIIIIIIIIVAMSGSDHSQDPDNTQGEVIICSRKQTDLYILYVKVWSKHVHS